MTTEYRVVTDWLCIGSGNKARKIEMRLNEMAPDGWEFAGLDAVTVLGFDIGYYLVVRRRRSTEPPTRDHTTGDCR